MTSSRPGVLKRIWPLARIVLAVGLIVLVLSLQQFRDRLEIPDGTVQRSYSGTLQGKGKTLEFTSSEVDATVERGDNDQVVRVDLRYRDGRQVELRRSDLKPGQNMVVAHGMISIMRNIDVPLFLVSFLFYFIASVVSVYRWYLLLRSAGLDVSLWLAFKLTFIGLFCNNFVPGLTGGDLIKAIYIARTCHREKATAVVTVLVDRGLGITGLALVAGAVIPFNWAKFSTLAWPIYGFLIAVFGGSCLFFSKRVRRAIKLNTLLQRLPFTKVLQEIDSSIYVYKSKLGTLFLSLGLSVMMHVLILSGVAVIGRALGILIPFYFYYSLVPLALIVQSLPIAPQGWGVGEFAFVFLFATVGVSSEQALALSLCFRVVMMTASLLGGLFMGTGKDRMRVKEAELEAELEAETTDVGRE